MCSYKFLCNRLSSFMVSFSVLLTCTFGFSWQQWLENVNRHFDVRRNLLKTNLSKFRKCLTIVRHDVRKIFILFTTVIFINKNSVAQDSITVDYLLDKIETQQLKHNNYFLDG